MENKRNLGALHYLLGHLGWAAAAALAVSLLSLAYSIIKVRKRLTELRTIKEQEDAHVPVASQGLTQALAGDAGAQKGSEEPRREVLAPSGQSSIEPLKQRAMGAK